ncbi:hypothetical protein [Lonomia obliqua multiple nucleopolyhedrovirus]|uniref:Uncharacterized protein n=1 Tax=Lonomia obliqua multiple nucleopolyhedrovirus TaxID=134394 RepID=A0A126FCA4_9ABAC|nr:hypothetical protein [Lonomia obliqua multiple nucleopolyhedrovirus]AKN81031.1 hypothetical protein [Lonomia obliqua multiple nucleopolyhedrovirus]
MAGFNFVKNIKKYTKLSNKNVTNKLKMPGLEVLSYFNITLTTYASLLIFYLSSFREYNAMVYLQYWLLLSFIINFIINIPAMIWPKICEVNEIIYEAKLFVSLYMSNELIRIYVFYLYEMAVYHRFVSNIMHIFVTHMVFMELFILYSHLSKNINYYFIKSCYMLAYFIVNVLIIFLVGFNNLTNHKLNDGLYILILAIVYCLIIILWTVKPLLLPPKQPNAKLQNIKIIYDDAPPPFSTIELANMLNDDDNDKTNNGSDCNKNNKKDLV